jgi:hypothetical protein
MTPTELLYLAIALQVITIAGLFAQQAQIRFLQNILHSAHENNGSLIETNESLIATNNTMIKNFDDCMDANIIMQERLERYIDIYGPLTEK